MSRGTITQSGFTERQQDNIRKAEQWFQCNDTWPPVRINKVVDNFGQWCNIMRCEKKGGRLSPDLVMALNAVGFLWDKSDHLLPGAPRLTADTLPKSVDNLDVLLDSAVRFPVIYADPPWRYGNQSTRGNTDGHYVTMPLNDIAAMPVSRLAAEDAWLFLWTTNGFLFESRDVLDGWGFTFKSQIIWNKRDPRGTRASRMGMGNYARLCHEHLLIAKRGNPPAFTRRNVRSVIDALPTKHSEKPEIFRQIVESVTLGQTPRLELFGRRTAPGWTVFGNEVTTDLLDGTY